MTWKQLFHQIAKITKTHFQQWLQTEPEAGRRTELKSKLTTVRPSLEREQKLQMNEDIKPRQSPAQLAQALQKRRLEAYGEAAKKSIYDLHQLDAGQAADVVAAVISGIYATDQRAVKNLSAGLDRAAIVAKTEPINGLTLAIEWLLQYVDDETITKQFEVFKRPADEN